MGYALKLGMVDFSGVAVDQVEYMEVKPCTELSLDQNTLTFVSAEETKTLVATKTPADTTDTLVWTSSNENVATVVDGVVTIHGIGSATITATCGNQTATASILQTSLKAQYDLKSVSSRYPGTMTVGDDKIMAINVADNQYVVGQPYHEGNEKLRVYAGYDYDVECVPVPYGASKIKLATSDGVAVSISYIYVVDTTDLIEYNSALYPKYLRSQTFVNTATGYDVEYGEAVVFRPVGTSQHDTLSYIYFE